MWVQVETAPDGSNDLVYLTTLLQCLQLNPGESPFFPNYGVPSTQSVLTQIFPDFYVVQTQQQFSGFFAALSVKSLAYADPKTGAPAPYYVVNVVTHVGTVLSGKVVK